LPYTDSREEGLEEDSISEELQKLVTRDYSSNISKAVCNRAINWSHFSGIIGFCAKIIEMNILDFKPGSRCYFMDLGLAGYYLSCVGATDSEIAGTLNRNYVYINLKKGRIFRKKLRLRCLRLQFIKGERWTSSAGHWRFHAICGRSQGWETCRKYGQAGAGGWKSKPVIVFEGEYERR